MSFDNKCDFWIRTNQNVLLVGKHGVGKTAIIKNSFERNNLKWKYFSASTMDPWTDFVGIPKETSSIINGKQVSHLQFIRPLEFATGEIEALFFDEFNRSPKKVRNAVMELLQFKSINGEKFPNLKIIWAAINPDDDENAYDVEKLDKAQLDRFEVQRKIEYRPDAEFFKNKFGQSIADSSISWWNELDEDCKNLVSPRRLEYALNFFSLRGDLRDILPKETNVSKLLQLLKDGPTSDRLASFLKDQNKEEAKIWLQNENNYSSAIRYIVGSKTLTEWFVPLMNKEKIISLMSQNEKITKYIFNNISSPIFSEICKDILDAKADTKMITKIRKYLTQNPEISKILYK